MNTKVKILLGVITDKTGVTLKQMKQDIRKVHIVHARRIFCVIAREKWNMTFQEIGEIINKDHATAIHAIKRHNNEIDMYEDYASAYREVYITIQTMLIVKTEFNVEYLNSLIDELNKEIKVAELKIGSYKRRIAKL